MHDATNSNQGNKIVTVGSLAQATEAYNSCKKYLLGYCSLVYYYISLVSSFCMQDLPD